MTDLRVKLELELANQIRVYTLLEDIGMSEWFIRAAHEYMAAHPLSDLIPKSHKSKK